MSLSVLLVGNSGMAHAFAWGLSRSSVTGRIHGIGANIGVAAVGECHDVDPYDVTAIADLAERRAIDIVVPLGASYLAAGVCDTVQARGIAAFGPTVAAARLENSKAFFKQLATDAGVPTPRYAVFDDPRTAIAGLDDFAPPYVVKCSGQADATAVRICDDRRDAEAAIRRVGALVDPGISDVRIILEEHVTGDELSFFAVTDGTSCRILPSARDHKRSSSAPGAPNTAGMGAFSPVPGVDPATSEELMAAFVTPILGQLRARGITYTGILYAGLISTPLGWQILEMNVRPGDPEAQVIVPRLETDLGLLLRETVEHRLAGLSLAARPDAYLGVALTPSDYPYDSTRNVPVTGLTEAAGRDGVLLFHSGLKRGPNGYLTTKGRITHVIGSGPTLADARTAAYSAVEQISFPGMHYRDDIGHQTVTQAHRRPAPRRRGPDG
ncbi:phosphoribosylamine--glycine ligase [Actinocorallia aurea]